VIAAIKFLVAHSTSIAISFRSKNEQAVERNRTMLDVSGTM
jgi:hypothetical protein